MSRNPEYQLVRTDTEELASKLIAAYEIITKTTVRPASPERLFILWIADAFSQERALGNYMINQNLPSRADGANLDALGEQLYNRTRPAAQAAFCTIRFYVSAPQTTAILVPTGTRVTDPERALIWATTKDAYITIGSLYADVMVQCQTAGLAGNDYMVGQINTAIDVFDFFERCENITASDGGANESSDDEYYETMRASQDSYSDAGARGAYIYFAKQVSTEIVDVVANSPSPGQVNIYVLMKGDEIAGAEIKNAVLAACNDDFVRPLTDYVVVDDPEVVVYNVDITYYIPRNASLSAAEVEAAVNAAVASYITWQGAKLGRDINPSYLLGLLMQTGIKRAEVAYPVFVTLRDGSDDPESMREGDDGTIPQVAFAGDVTITNGGYEDD
ncbi:MAG: baseplate J/gp47 family protein [Oscillospiraceae bacterium]|jgi:phage-related baseplate assembly protein|nr:baseplate J/gp47 family protein [Oscillospiraceae bacterium]